MPLPVDVDSLELEVELLVCDVLVEVSDGDAGTTVVSTTATLVVVGSGVTVVGTIVLCELVVECVGVDEVVGTTVVVEEVAAA